MGDTTLDADFTPLKKESTLSDVLGANFSLAWDATSLGAINKMRELSGAERTDDLVDPLTLNKMYPEIDVSFTEPTSKAKAEVMSENAKERQGLQRVIANGDDSFATNALGFASGLVATAIDPVGILAGVATAGTLKGAGIYRAMAKTYLGRNALAMSIATGVTEGVVGNVIEEAALVIPSQIADNESVNVYNNITNAVIGGMAFATLKGAAVGTFNYVKKLKNPVQFEQVTALTEAKIESGNRPTPTTDEMKLIDGDEFDASRVDEVKLREEANSIEQKTYYDPEVAERIKTIDDVEEITNILQHTEEKFQEIEANTFETKMDEATITEIKTIRERSKAKIEADDYAARLVQACVGRS